MLGLLLIYFIGKYFFDLAVKHEKSKWGFAILGVVTYYAGTFVAGVIIAVLMEQNKPGSIDEMNDLVLGIISLPFGVAASSALYFILKKNWQKQEHFDVNVIEEIGSKEEGFTDSEVIQ